MLEVSILHPERNKRVLLQLLHFLDTYGPLDLGVYPSCDMCDTQRTVFWGTDSLLLGAYNRFYNHRGVRGDGQGRPWPSQSRSAMSPRELATSPSSSVHQGGRGS